MNIWIEILPMLVAEYFPWLGEMWEMGCAKWKGWLMWLHVACVVIAVQWIHWGCNDGVVNLAIHAFLVLKQNKTKQKLINMASTYS